MPSIDPSGLHSSIVQLRNTYRSTEKAYSKDKDAKSLPLYDRYIEVLVASKRNCSPRAKAPMPHASAPNATTSSPAANNAPPKCLRTAAVKRSQCLRHQPL
jgi:hypothetical protein